LARNSSVKLCRKCWKSTALCTESPCHILPNRMVQQIKKIIQLWKALILCFMPVDCQNNCGLKPVVLWYTYSTILDLQQWKVRCLCSCGLDLMQLSVTVCVWERMLCAHSQTEKAQVGPKE
jgi:hypothetical protein